MFKCYPKVPSRIVWQMTHELHNFTSMLILPLSSLLCTGKYKTNPVIFYLLLLKHTLHSCFELDVSLHVSFLSIRRHKVYLHIYPKILKHKLGGCTLLSLSTVTIMYQMTFRMFRGRDHSWSIKP